MTGPVLLPDTIRVTCEAPGMSLSFPAHSASIVRRQWRSFRPPDFSDYPWRVDDTGWVKYVALRVDNIEAHVYADGHIALEVG